MKEQEINRLRAAFIAKWRNQMAGIALYGAFTEHRMGQMERAAETFKICEQVPRWLERVFNDVIDQLINERLIEDVERPIEKAAAVKKS